MPYKSEAQRRFFHANKDSLEKKGVDVSEWDEASKGKKLPESIGDHLLKSLPNKRKK